MRHFSKRILRLISRRYPDTKRNYVRERRVVDLARRRVFRLGERITDDIVKAPDRDIPVRVFYPGKNGAYPVLVFFHGGGWVTGSLESYEKVCIHMANQTKSIIVSVGYRLAPEHKFPAAPEDCYFVTQYLAENRKKFGIPKDGLTLIGDSAGGNLAAVVSLMSRDRGGFIPHRQILIYPSVAGTRDPRAFPSFYENGDDYVLTKKRIADYMDLYENNRRDLENPYLAPLLARNLSHQPHTLIVTAELDPLRDEGEAYGRRLREAGNRVEIHRFPDVIHGFLSTGIFPSAVKNLYECVNAFLYEESRISERSATGEAAYAQT